MRVVVAIDSFKGSLSSYEANQSACAGIKNAVPNAELSIFPMADGGEGTVDALIEKMRGEKVAVSVTGPLYKKVQASYGIVREESMAVIEIAEACGLPLLDAKELNPSLTTSYGVGELIAHAYQEGCRKFVIGLGGSATNDGGVGMLQALGFKFLDYERAEINYGGEELSRIHKIEATDESDKYRDCDFRVACDVTNLLCGNHGASYIFGPQKGANPEMVIRLDKCLENFAQTTFQELGIELKNIEGGGAAGGLGAAFYGYLNARLESGINLVLDTLGIEEQIKEADLVITGEGKMDGQTSMGKVPAGLALLSSKHEVPVIGIAGNLTSDAYQLNHSGIQGVFSIQTAPISMEKALDKEVAAFNIEKTVEQIIRVSKLFAR
ncbi:glycerate kinase [Salinicoccus roseus]|uniref:glycerate kinase family protein n=1 Tax=Salinicoccus roseus TaxID=45670 RepID=UPI003524C9BD